MVATDAICNGVARIGVGADVDADFAVRTGAVVDFVTPFAPWVEVAVDTIRLGIFPSFAVGIAEGLATGAVCYGALAERQYIIRLPEAGSSFLEEGRLIGGGWGL